MCRRFIILAVNPLSNFHLCRREMSCKGIRQTERRSQPRAVRARSQHIDGNIQSFSGNSADSARPVVLGKISFQLADLPRELLIYNGRISAQSRSGYAICARRSADAEINTARI